MQTSMSRFWQVVRFCCVGGISVPAGYITLYCFTEYLKVWYVLSAVIAFAVNWGLNFVLQKLWTFQNKEPKTVHRQAMQYFTMAVSFTVGNTILLYCMVKYLNMWYMAAQVILTIFFSVVSYFVTKHIFTHKGDSHARDQSLVSPEVHRAQAQSGLREHH